MKYNKILLIHGIAGIKVESYFHSVKKRCEELGLEVIMPSLGGYRENITYKTWEDIFDKDIKDKLDKNTIVVAQSNGTQFFVRYLVKNNLDIGVYISCAAPYDITLLRGEEGVQFLETAKYFKLKDEEFDKFSKTDFDKYSLYCDNDMFFEQSNLEKYVNAINSKPIFIKGKGHFNRGLTKLEELEELIEKLVEE